MRIRPDFVSNSSSSSFIVSNEQGCATLLFQKYAEIFRNCQVSYDYDDSISIYAYTKRKDHDTVRDFIVSCNGSEEESETFSSLDEYSSLELDKVVLDENEEHFDPLILSLDNFAALASRPDISKKITRLYFSTASDFNEAQDARLASLFKFFDAIGCHPDDSSSERDFLRKDLDKFEQTLNDYISKSEKQKENQI